MQNEITVDGNVYILKSCVTTGNRAVVVADRGWIFAGDVTEKNGRIFLDRVVWVYSWQNIGFAGVLADPKSDHVSLRPMPTRVELPKESELFRCPVSDDWGL